MNETPQAPITRLDIDQFIRRYLREQRPECPGVSILFENQPSGTKGDILYVALKDESPTTPSLS